MPTTTLPFAAPKETYLSQRGYAIDINRNEEMVAYLKDFCTVKPFINPNAPGSNIMKQFAVYRESSHKLYIPRSLGMELLGVPTHNTMHQGDDTNNMEFNGTLRPEQELAANAFIDATKNPTKCGGIISIPCGGGKTTISLYLASVLKKKMLVVCHKEFLINQWRERIQQFLPNAKVGLIKAKALDIDGCDIVIASLQSLAMKDYDPKLFRPFGFVAIDEVHHTSAEVFSQALPKINAQVMLGLSATLERKDGLRKVFEWYLGRPVYSVKKHEDRQMIIDMPHFYESSICRSYGREEVMRNGKLNIAAMITSICSHAPRNKLIIDKLETLLKKEPGRQVLILSDRKGHLYELESLIKARNLGSTGFYVGGMKEEALAKSSRCDFILGTNMMAAEGMDIPTLNTLVLASPIGTVEQQLGRIQRQRPHERKYTPYTIDIVDDFSIFSNQGIRRATFYKRRGYTIVDDDEVGPPSKSKSGPKRAAATASRASPGACAFLSDEE